MPPEHIHRVFQSIDQRDRRPVIMPELQFLKVEWDLRRVDPMRLHQPFLGEGPEAFDPVEVNHPIGESFAVIDPFVTKAAETGPL